MSRRKVSKQRERERRDVLAYLRHGVSGAWRALAMAHAGLRGS